MGLSALGAAWIWWLPSVVASRVEQAVSSRLGLAAEVGDVDLGLGGTTTLEEVQLRGRHGGVEIDLRELELSAGIFALAFGGPSAVDEVDVDGVEVRIDLSAGGAEESLATIRDAVRARASSAAADPTAAESSGRAVRARAVTVEARDATGELLAVRDASAELAADGGARLAAAEVDIGTEPGHRLSMRGLAATLARSAEGGVQIASAEVQGGELVWAETQETEEAPADEEGPPTTLSRLLALARAVRGADGEAAEEPEPESDGPPWARRLTDGATFTLREVVVRQGDQVVVRELRSVVTHRGGGVLHLEGTGAPATDGSLRWDLEAAPAALRAEGTVAFEGLPLALVAPLLADIPWHEPERARLDGELTLAGEGTDPIALSGRLTVRDAALSSSRIAPEPISGITVTVEGGGTFHPQSRRLEIDRATITLGEAQAELTGALEWAPSHYLVDLTATLPATDCGVAIAAIPHDLVSDLAGFSWSGRIGGRIVAHVDSRALPETRLDIDVADGCQFQTVPAIADLRRVQGPFLHRVLEPNGTWFEMTTGPGTGTWASIHTISPYLVHAVLAHEDASFFRHGGFAPWAIRDALERNLEQGRYAIGASTITMQLAKNLFLHREKTLARKVQEVLLTWWLESALDKTAILELYLNVIEYGPAVYGIRQAAEHYFGISPEDLSPAQSAFIANVLPNPKLYHHQYERNELSASMRNRMERLLRHMHARGRIDDAALEHGLAELAAFRFHPEGAPPPEPQPVAGTAAPLPFATSGRAIWADPWEDWASESFEDPAEGAPEDDQDSPKASADHPGGVRAEGAGGPRITAGEAP